MRNLEKLIIVLLLIVAVTIPACSQKDLNQPAKVKQSGQENQSQDIPVTTASGLTYIDLIAGTGPSPAPGNAVKVHYTGWLENGTKFDSSVDRQQPFVFRIGSGEVIPGWDEGVLTMKKGGKRKLFVPGHLGYGAAGAGNAIPPNATLVFEVELLDFGG